MKLTRKSFSLAIAAITVAGISFAGASAIQDGMQGDRQDKMAKDGKNIVETAKAAGQFNTLTKALAAADLVKVLEGDGPFTVFAPTDEAFSALPTGTLDDLLQPESKKKLQQILLYHVASGKVMAADVMKLKEVETAQGGAIKIAARDNKVFLNGKTEVIKTDIAASNGVIHVINGVLMPTTGERGSIRQGDQDNDKMDDDDGNDGMEDDGM